jgi:large subunit ribosomal protein L6
MSRIGKNPVEIPSGVTVTVAGQTVKAKGAKGEISQIIHAAIKVEVKENKVFLSPAAENSDAGALWGLSRTLVSNLIEGVSKGFSKTLIVKGVGYKFAMKGKDLELQLGFSHPVLIKTPAGISFELDAKKNTITIQGIDKQLVGEVAANIRKWIKPEPYKGKGIAYEGEHIQRKAGKSAGGGAKA